ncbi:hypothetical protein IFM89_004277 [Coptis chinensis]|uniref:FAR1 domain-containing protein n=1 Tax=Coptis chinensis TaxID=261450 RepID=A0A835ME42_9MAGN|nr:hypothetical protein IFM89_004277 [Coptis chinensis]
MDDSILINEVGEQEEYGLVPEPYMACSSSVQPLKFEVEVEIVKPPCLGMCFETLEATKQFYIDYEKSFGFSPVIRSSKKSYSRSDECDRFVTVKALVLTFQSLLFEADCCGNFMDTSLSVEEAI